MPKPCSICAHESRMEIEKALVAPDANLRGISRIFRVSEDALSRHVKNGHIIEKIAKAAAAQEAVEANDLLNEILVIEDTTRAIIKAAMDRKLTDKKGVKHKDPDHEVALKALARREKQIELKGRVLGSFKDVAGGGSTSVTVVQPLLYVPDNKRREPVAIPPQGP